ncbi:CRP-like cAMP-binding protein [Rhizobium beringeri]
MDDEQLNFRNELLRAMSPQERDLIVPHMKPITLDVPLILEMENTPVGDIYILESGLASIVARFPGGRDIEVGIVGREGMTGAAVMLGGDQSANRTFMQVSGHGFKLPASILSSAMHPSFPRPWKKAAPCVTCFSHMSRRGLRKRRRRCWPMVMPNSRSGSRGGC